MANSTPTNLSNVQISEDLAFGTSKFSKSITVSLAAGAVNSTNCTITVVDSQGTAIAAVHALEVYINRAADGTGGLTSTAATGALTASTGAILTALTAKKHIKATTDVNGVLVLNLVDTAKTAGDYFQVVNPLTGRLHASTATVTGSFG